MDEEREKRIETLVGLLRDRDENAREQTFDALSVPDSERREVLNRLARHAAHPAGGLSPEALQDNKHFKQLVALARRGKVILFIGAGASVDVGMPSTSQILDVLRAEAIELGVEIPCGTFFSEAARIVEDIVGRQDLADLLHRIFDHMLKTEPPPHRRGGYRLLAALPKQLTKVVVTTNWDSLLRRAFEHAEESAIEILDGEQLRWVPAAKHAIVKLHGGFENPGAMVITETDYAAAVAQIARRTVGTLWGYVASLLSQYSFVFVGYSLEDSDFRLLQRLVQTEVRTRPAPDFFVTPLSSVDEQSVSPWAGIRRISATATNFLLALFRELDEFVNRQDELDLAFRRPSSPFIEFYGPFGSGKTALLDAAERRAQVEEWSLQQIMRVDWGFRRDGTLRDPVQNRTDVVQVLNEDLEPSVLLKRFEDLGGYLRDKLGAFLIFDSTERVHNQRDLVSLLVDVVSPVIQEMNGRGQHCKLVIGGRYPLRKWPYSFRRSLRSHALTPFDASVVREMAQKFLLATDPDSQERFEPELIADILEVSSGHAGFIKTILLDLMSEERRNFDHIRLPPRLTEKVKREYVSRFNADIDRQMPWEDEALKRVYEEILCVFRWLNREMVRELDLPLDPFSALTAIYVLSPDDFSNDQVVRRTKMFWLRYEWPTKFVEAHEKAQKTFILGVERLLYPLQVDYILEWLFHTAHLLIVQVPKSVRARRGRLVGHIEPLHYRADREQVRGEIGSQLVRRIAEKDRELWNILEECVGEDGVEEVLAILERKEVFDVG